MGSPKDFFMSVTFFFIPLNKKPVSKFFKKSVE